MNRTTPHNNAQIVATLLALPAVARPPWLAAHRAACTLELIAAFKAHSDPLGLSDPQAAEAATECVLLVAEYCDHPLGYALAAWARGNLDMYNEPQQAIARYRQALHGYRVAGDDLSVARLLTNLVFPLTECGLLVEAEAAADEARLLLRQRADSTKRFQMVLEQNAGWLLHNQGRYAEALQVYGRALDLAYELDDITGAAEIQVNRTITLEVFGHIAEEEATLIESRELAAQHGQRLTVTRIDLNLGELYVALGRPVEALRRLQAARAGFAALGNQMELAAVVLAEAALFSWLGALREARRSYAGARSLFAALDMQPQVGVALLRGAVANRRAGAFSIAAELVAQAATLWQRLEQPLWQATVQVEQAELALAQGEATAALDCIEPLLGQTNMSSLLAAQCRLIEADALALRWWQKADEQALDDSRQAYLAARSAAEQVGDRGLLRRAQAGYGKLRWSSDPALAQVALESALVLDEATRQALSSEELKASFQGQRDDLLAPLVQIAMAKNDPFAALAAIWRIKGGALLDVIHTLDRTVTTDDAVKQARERLAVLRWRHTLEASLDDLPDMLRERADPQIQVAEDELRVLLRQRQRVIDTHHWQHNPRQLLGTMHADILIEYARCNGEVVAVRADRNGNCSVVPLAPASTIAALIDDLQLHIQHVVSLTPEARSRDSVWLDECQTLLQDLHAVLVAPLGPLPIGAHLLIAPCDPIYLVPFAALHNGLRYLVEDHPLVITPCAALLGTPWPNAPTEGAIILTGSAEGRLDGVAAEATAVAAVLPWATLWHDQPAGVAAIQQRPLAPTLLHIAAHSVLREDAPLFSALQLHSELLSVEQCYDLRLRGTALVTLSGCTTGAGLETGGSLLAFQTAFFAAGARAVLGSLWPIDDAATADWMGHFYGLLAAGLTPEAALCQTQRDFIQKPGWQHPALWAAFACAARSFVAEYVIEH